MAKYITFIEIHDTGKTKVYDVKAFTGNDLLGKVCWYSGWRRYVFFPESKTLFDFKCLNDISDFINGLMEARK